MRRLLPALGLLCLSPLVAEYLLGDVPITSIALLLAMIPLYGCGALLIREVVRRAGYGWPSILAFGLAYGMIEEGFTTFTLFDPNWAGFHVLTYGYIPSLGISLNWTIFVMGLHTFWSIGTPIALMEALAGKQQRTTPWLGKIGLAVVATVFALFVIGPVVYILLTHRFHASVPQVIGTSIAIIIIVGIGILLGQRNRAPHTQTAGHVPSPWLVMLVALVATSIFQLIYAADPYGLSPWLAGLHLPAWAAIVLYLLLLCGMAVPVGFWSRQSGWSDAHRFALAAGALLTYIWHSFPWPVLMPGVDLMNDLLSNAIFAAGAIALLIIAARWLKQEEQPVVATVPAPGGLLP
ncbi:hypothetical protein [Ktedonospora formicarum]|uniref:Uncharacterized protein n=1 Tax=Ktedonospora formicarum TaxID=2778364 RepID=A0A8J3MV02_9CHLR|nr:hypothetical protein [Ktedonospora formicarum]GHO47456.1 hypothetical protein KSX_56190 [Ktedonospora formicarum]